MDRLTFTVAYLTGASAIFHSALVSLLLESFIANPSLRLESVSLGSSLLSLLIIFATLIFKFSTIRLRKLSFPEYVNRSKSLLIVGIVSCMSAIIISVQLHNTRLCSSFEGIINVGPECTFGVLIIAISWAAFVSASSGHVVAFVLRSKAEIPGEQPHTDLYYNATTGRVQLVPAYDVNATYGSQAAFTPTMRSRHDEKQIDAGPWWI